MNFLFLNSGISWRLVADVLPILEHCQGYFGVSCYFREFFFENFFSSLWTLLGYLINFFNFQYKKFSEKRLSLVTCNRSVPLTSRSPIQEPLHNLTFKVNVHSYCDAKYSLTFIFAYKESTKDSAGYDNWTISEIWSVINNMSVKWVMRNLSVSYTNCSKKKIKKNSFRYTVPPPYMSYELIKCLNIQRCIGRYSIFHRLSVCFESLSWLMSNVIYVQLSFTIKIFIGDDDVW